jgi:hypothetical protein
MGMPSMGVRGMRMAVAMAMAMRMTRRMLLMVMVMILRHGADVNMPAPPRQEIRKNIARRNRAQL